MVASLSQYNVTTATLLRSCMIPDPHYARVLPGSTPSPTYRWRLPNLCQISRRRWQWCSYGWAACSLRGEISMPSVVRI